MKIVFAIILALIFPSRVRAQFNFAPGSYRLTNGATGTAALKLVLAEGGSPTMMVGVKNGKERKFRSTEITSFAVDTHQFITASGFRFRSGEDQEFTDPVILETMDTGAVELFYYYYLVAMGTNFTGHAKLPVLRKRGTNTFFVYCPSRTPGFDQRLAPGTFVAALFPADPILQRQFATNSISRAQLVAAVHAYNQGVRLTR